MAFLIVSLLSYMWLEASQRCVLPVVQVTSMHFTVYTAQNFVGNVYKNMSHDQGSPNWVPVFQPKIVAILPASTIFAHSPAPYLLIQTLSHDLFVKSTVHTNPVLINLNSHPLLWMQVVRQRGYAVSSIFWFHLTMDNEDPLHTEVNCYYPTDWDWNALSQPDSVN